MQKVLGHYNGYERIQQGDLTSFRFEDAKSTAQSMLIIGCSGSGKTTSLQRILTTYPQVIYHANLNFEQVVYLKIDCSHNGSLKEICLNFFRALDQAIGANYEKRYGLKRHSIETMLALMAQIANTHALGLLVIDEIQHLSRSRSGGSQEMLNFFVTLVNTIGVPIMLIGTPKAREIFEADLRSARRGAGFGSMFWEHMPNIINQKPNLEWVAFTNNLWKLQLLKNSDSFLSDEIRETWYDLSQGIMDIVVKLFVLAQLRALALNKERITPQLLKQVYEDELKPVHPMLAALRSGIPEKIAKYSDLVIPEIDKQLIQLHQSISHTKPEPTPEDLAQQELISEDERRVYSMLKDGYDSSLLVSIIKNTFQKHTEAKWTDLLPTIVTWLNENPPHKTHTTIKDKATSPIKSEFWDTLSQDDLRYVHSQLEAKQTMHEKLKSKGLITDLSSLFEQAS